VHKLVYIVDWLPPDYGAIGQYALKESEERAAAGEHVVLVGLTTGAPRTDTKAVGSGRLTTKRLHSEPVDRANFRRRALWTLKTNLRLISQAAMHLATADEVLFTASPPFLEHLLVPLSRLTRRRVVFRIADLHPECLMNELASIPGWLRVFHGATRALRRNADRVEVLGEDQKRILVAQGVTPERITLKRSGSPVSISSDTRPLPTPDALQGKHILLYSGAVAHAHDLSTFVEGYRRHHEEGSRRVRFWLSASGVRADELENRIRALGLPMHRSAPVPLTSLASLLVTPDAHLITLRNEYAGLVVPSKVYGCIESRRDVLFVGSAASDVDLLCARALGGQSYTRVEVGDAEGVAAALEKIASHAAEREQGRTPHTS
jgi:hypothetical protein